jgi:hypothetical protein
MMRLAHGCSGPLPVSRQLDLASRYELNRTEMGRACMLSGSDIRGMEDALDTGLWEDEFLDPET